MSAGASWGGIFRRVLFRGAGDAPRTRSLFWRLSAFTCVWAAVLLAAGGIGLTTLYRSAIQRDLSAGLDATIALLLPSIEVDGARSARVAAQLPDPRYGETFSGRYWWIALADAPGEPVDQSRSVWDQTLTIDQAAVAEAIASPPGIVTYSHPGPEGQRLQTHVRFARLGVGAQGVLIFASADRSSLDRDVRTFRVAVLWTLAALAIALLAAVFVLVRLGLRPLYHFGVAVGEIRAGERTALERDAPGELIPLADELNALVAHNRTIVENAQARAGDLAHALKTPIAVLLSEADGETTPLADQVRKQVAVMGGHVDRHLKSAGAAARARDIKARTVLSPVLEDLIRTVPKLHPQRRIAIDLAASPLSETVTVRGGREDVMEMIGNVLDNAMKWANAQVVVRVVDHGPAELAVVIDDDGPGLPADQREAVVRRGARLDEAVAGSGLGLAIVRDLVGAMGGSLHLSESHLGGLCVSIRLLRGFSSAT